MDYLKFEEFSWLLWMSLDCHQSLVVNIKKNTLHHKNMYVNSGTSVSIKSLNVPLLKISFEVSSYNRFQGFSKSVELCTQGKDQLISKQNFQVVTSSKNKWNTLRIVSRTEGQTVNTGLKKIQDLRIMIWFIFAEVAVSEKFEKKSTFVGIQSCFLILEPDKWTTLLLDTF